MKSHHNLKHISIKENIFTQETIAHSLQTLILVNDHHLMVGKDCGISQLSQFTEGNGIKMIVRVKADSIGPAASS